METILQRNLKKLIKEAKIKSLQELEAKTGLAKSTLHGVINGAVPTLKTAHILAEFFDISLDLLVYGRVHRNIIEQMYRVGDTDNFFRIKIEKSSDQIPSTEQFERQELDKYYGINDHRSVL